jgi:MFS family permease
MQATAQGFLVFQLTHSAAYLGYVGFAAGVPSLLLMLYGGVVNGRISQRSVLMVTQTSMMALAFALGIANAFDAPARQALVLEMVRREDLSNAVALNSTMFNLATVVGPALGGITYALPGPA